VGFLFLSGVDTLMHAAADTLHAAADSVHAAGAESGSEIAEYLLEHVQDSHHLETPFGYISLPHFEPVQFMGICFDLSITKYVVFLWIAASLLIVGLGIAGWQNSRRKVPRGFGNMIEIVIVFIRDEIVLPNMGHDGMKYLHYLLTTFFFILILHL